MSGYTTYLTLFANFWKYCLLWLIALLKSTHTATTIPTLVTTAPTHPVSATTSGTQTNTGSQSTSAPTSDPTSPTCQALETLQSSAQSLICNRNDQCDTVHCRVTDTTVQVFISAANLTLLPCNQPPAVRLSINNPSGGVVVDRVISQSENIFLPPQITLNVTLDQLTNAIGFEVSQHADLQLVSMLLCVVSICTYGMHESRLPIGGLAA